MTVVDLFAGAGGWDVAAHKLGLDTVGIELDTTTCATRRAAGHNTVRADLYDYPPRPSIGLIGSPPCPAFSIAGNGEGLVDVEPLQRVVSNPDRLTADGGGWNDPTSALIVQTARWAHLAQGWVALEQVPAVLPVWRAMAQGLMQAGWNSTWTGILNAADYGVPQTRRRAILIAHRHRPVTPPAPTHAETPEPSMFGETLTPWVSMADALGWDGSVGYHRGVGMSERHGTRPPRPTDRAAPTVTTHTGKDWVLNTRRDQRPDGTTQTRPLTKPAPTMTTISGSQWIFTRPAPTITGDSRITTPGRHITGLGYSSQYGPNPVKVTVEEAAALQSFPSDYPWQGTKTSKFAQIGNAIPVGLAKAILEVVL